MGQVFLSYSRKDADVMRRVRDALYATKLDVWTDSNLEPGTPAWQSAIGEAIEESQVMVALLSPDAKVSKWVAKEISYAEKLGLMIIPALVRGTDLESVPFLLNDYQYIDLRSQPDRKIGELVAVVRGKLGQETEQEANKYKTFWQQLFDRSRNQTRLFGKITPGTQDFIATGAGKAGLYYQYYVFRKVAALDLYIDTGEHDKNKELFDKLFAHKEAIETDFGEPLEWRRLEEKRASRIVKHIEDQGGISTPETWAKLQDAMIDAMIHFDNAIHPWIIQL